MRNWPTRTDINVAAKNAFEAFKGRKLQPSDAGDHLEVALFLSQLAFVRIDVDHSIFAKRQTSLEQAYAEKPAGILRHGNKPEDCDACYAESDLAYDAARGS